MKHCCDAKKEELQTLSANQKRVLWAVLWINLIMFFVESAVGWWAHSSALLADSLDMLGDALVYAISLVAVGRSLRWNASVSLLKGGLMLVSGAGVIAQVIRRWVNPELPHAEMMGWMGALALAANLGCAILLLRHRSDDLNMRSTWLCSRNDVIANVGILISALLVAMLGSKVPDLALGLAIAGLVIYSAWDVMRASWRGLRNAKL